MPLGVPQYSPSPATVPTPLRGGAALAAVVPAPALPSLLMVGANDQIPTFVPALRQQFRVLLATSVTEAIGAIERERPSVIVTELVLQDGGGSAVVAAAKRFDPAPTVLVVSAEPQGVPDALAAGCDGVLLSPFAPNLLYARIGRLMRDRARDLRLRANVRLHPDAVAERSRGTNRYWENEHCPNCRVKGVTSFEFHSHRRAWFACVHCRTVWIGRRLEDF